MKLPKFNTKEDLFAYLKANKSVLIAEKKYNTKHGDTVVHFITEDETEEEITKAISNPSAFTGNEINVKLVLNTTGIMDSHSDVHIKGIWNKTIKENKNLYLLEEHKMSFRNIISDKVKASVQTMKWSELGYGAQGETQALIFNSTISKERNPYMFDQYVKGYVKNHSVGMQYVSLSLAMNSDSPSDKEEKAVWDKYINEISNKDEVEAQGYFWAVTEAKLIEGSAVPIGSNKITPTLSVEEKNIEAENITSTEPQASTQKTNIDYNYLLNNLNK